MSDLRLPDPDDEDLIKAYAAELIDLVDDDLHPDEMAAISNWRELHSIRDANEYLIEADERLGILDPFSPREGEDDFVDPVELDRYNTFTNAAIAIAESRLFGRHD